MQEYSERYLNIQIIQLINHLKNMRSLFESHMYDTDDLSIQSELTVIDYHVSQLTEVLSHNINDKKAVYISTVREINNMKSENKNIIKQTDNEEMHKFIL